MPQAFYWAIATVTATGYGDLVPTSVIGKILACTAMALGIFLLAIPAVLIGFQFQLEYEMYRARVEAFKERRAATAAQAASAVPAAAEPAPAAQLQPRGGGGTGSPLIMRMASRPLGLVLSGGEQLQEQPPPQPPAAQSAAEAAIWRRLDEVQSDVRAMRATLDALARSLGRGGQ